jgi:hypothetical protein
MGLLLYILSLVLTLILFPIGFLFAIVKAVYKRKVFSEGIRTIDDKLFSLAKAVDIYGNVACCELFNVLFIQRGSKRRFGNYGETISSVIGKNKLCDTLTRTGKLLDAILEFFDKGHSINAIQWEKSS